MNGTDQIHGRPVRITIASTKTDDGRFQRLNDALAVPRNTVIFWRKRRLRFHDLLQLTQWFSGLQPTTTAPPNHPLQPTGAAITALPGPRPIRRPRRLNWSFGFRSQKR